MIDSSRPDYLHLHLLRREVQRVARHVHGRLLDVGCGCQPYRELLAPRVDRYVGFDVPPEQWHGASTRADVYGCGRELPFRDRSFDTVVCFQVLEHVSEPWRILDQAARVLRPGGRLILTTPQHFHVHGAPDDFFRFTRHGLVALAERAGLLTVECTEQGGGWVAVSESVLQYFTRHYWRTVRRPGLARGLCRLGNRLFGWLDRRFPYPGNPCNLTLVARRPGSLPQPRVRRTAAAPTVSVIIPCYNAARYVGQAIGSVLEQTRPPLEVIVVDDGSTDGSADVVAGFGGSVRLICQDNQGRAGAVRTALTVATGELVAFVDADDWWAPRKLEVQTEALLAQRAGLVHCPAIRCDRDGAQRASRVGAPTARWALPQLLLGNRVCGNTVLVRRSVLNRVGAFVGKYWPCDDYHLWLRIAAVTPFAYVDRPLAYYRTHGQQVSQDRVRMLRREMAVVHDFLDGHPDVLRALSPRLVRQACVGRFIARGVRCFDSGDQATARGIFRECLRRWPAHRQVLHYTLLSHLPWSWYARMIPRAGAA